MTTFFIVYIIIAVIAFIIAVPAFLHEDEKFSLEEDGGAILGFALLIAVLWPIPLILGSLYFVFSIPMKKLHKIMHKMYKRRSER